MVTKTQAPKEASPQLAAKVLEGMMAALLSGALPDVQWSAADDLCDCVYQRIGEWNNIYLAETLRVRLCCIWAEFEKQWPQFFERVPAYWDGNRDRWVREPQPWDSEDAAMPLHLWYRQVARQEGISLSSARERCQSGEFKRPRKVPAGMGRSAGGVLSRWEIEQLRNP